MSDLRTRILTILLLLVVFGGGAVAGVVVDRTWLRPRRSARSGDRTERMVERFRRRLELEAKQVKKVRALLSSGRESARAIRRTIAPKLAAERKRTRDEIVKLLTPPQQKRYLEMVERYERRRAARRNRSK